MSSPPLSQGDQSRITEARNEASTVSNAMSRLCAGGRHKLPAFVGPASPAASSSLIQSLRSSPAASLLLAAWQKGRTVMAYYMVRLYSGTADRPPEQLCQQAGS